MTGSGHLLAAEGVHVRLGGHAVLSDLDLAVAEGEVLGIFGPSGAGKSTLFRALAGEQTLARGRVRLGGEDVSAMPLWQRARRGLGYLPQTPSVLWDLTVAENLAVFAELAGRLPRGAARPVDAAAIARELGLGDRMNVAAGALSGGERRRLELARALGAAPRVLLCDEPFAALDPVGAASVGAALARLAEGGSAVIVADHHVADALRLCHRAALLLEGRIALLAPVEEFRLRPLVRKHYLVDGAP